jgi:hypothetical protein
MKTSRSDDVLDITCLWFAFTNLQGTHQLPPAAALFSTTMTTVTTHKAFHVPKVLRNELKRVVERQTEIIAPN